VSNDVSKAGPDRAVWAALLTPQGKFLHEFFVVESGDTLLLDAEAGRLDDLHTRIKRYKLRAKVEITPRADLCVAAVVEATSVLPDIPGGVVFADPRLPEAGLRIILPREGAAAALAGAGFTEGPVTQWEAHRLTLGLPDGARDIPVEKGFLLEYGFDELHGTDFQKGCYIGQETTARMKWKKLTKKRLMPVTVAGPLPAPGTPVMAAAGSAVGEMRSGLAETGGEGLGLAVLKLDALGKGPFTAGEATLTPRRPAWMRLPETA